MYTADVRELLTDPHFDRNRRLLRLQGQRGQALEQAVAAGWAMRLGPAQCALLGAVALLVAESWLYLVLAVTSSLGVMTRHHPVEWVYVWWAPRHGRTPPPPNRAPRRFACLLGAITFLVAATGLAVDLPLIFWAAGGFLVVLPTVVATTNVCVPSLFFTLLVGADRATASSLRSALRRGPGRPSDDSPPRTSAVSPDRW
jgi:hypothetical protein